MKAVIVTGGKQYTVAEGDVLYIEKLEAEAEATVKFDAVLAILDKLQLPRTGSHLGKRRGCSQSLRKTQGGRCQARHAAERERSVPLPFHAARKGGT